MSGVIRAAMLAAICVVGCGCGGAEGPSNGAAQRARGAQATAAADGRLSAGTVASIAGSPITEATLDHWVAVQAATDYETVPNGPIPAGVVPDPPGFRACIAYLRSGGGSGEQRRAPRTNVELMAECEAHYRTLRAHVFGILISFKWWEGEVKMLGISISQEKVATEFARFRGEEYHSLSNYQRYLRRTGQTLADQYLRMRMDLATNALREHFMSEGVDGYARYAKEFAREWASKTSCRASDVVPNCKEYRGGAAPEAML